jgi:excisionase family DNA binding protein
MTTAPAIIDALWKPEDVAAYLQKSRSWVYAESERGRLPTLRVGGSLRFEPEAIRAWARGEPVFSAKVLSLGGKR